MPLNFSGVKISGRLIAWTLGILLFITLLFSSCATVGKDEVGLLHKVYGFTGLPAGSIIAVNGENGPQARVLGPGVNIVPFLRIIYDVKMDSVFHVPQGMVLCLVAKDGEELPPGATFAELIPAAKRDTMIKDAEYFLSHGGKRGPQATVLGPGTHRLNTYLWETHLTNATVVPAGFVGTVKSNVHSEVDFGTLVAAKPEGPVELAIDTVGIELLLPLVKVGCVGVWETPLSAGTYYLNPEAYEILDYDTRLLVWEYKGGYTKRTLNLTLSDAGDIEQEVTSEEAVTPSEAADRAITVKCEGWDIWQEMRVIAQIYGHDAPYLRALVGGIPQLEDRVITPIIRSEGRNVLGSKNTHVRDLVENRDELEPRIEAPIQREALKHRVNISEVRLGDPAIPPEYFLPQQRKQLAQGLSDAYREERNAQQARITVEKAWAEAEAQGDLVRSEIAIDVARNEATAAEERGRGRKAELDAVGQGMAAISGALGSEGAVDLQKFELSLGLLKTMFNGEHDSLLAAGIENAHKFFPHTVLNVHGEGGGDNGAYGPLAFFSAMLGNLQTASPAVADATGTAPDDAQSE